MPGLHRGNASGSHAWSRVAPLYDLQLVLERPALRVLAALLELGGSERLLDVGTGTGAMLRELANSAPRPRSAVGLDASRAMLRRVPALPEGWNLVEGEAGSLPFEAGQFQAATACYLLHLLDQRQRRQVLGETHRVLVAGGRIGVITVAPPAGRVTAALSRPLRALAAKSGGVLTGLSPLDPHEDLAATGFRPYARRRIRRGYPSLCVVAERA